MCAILGMILLPGCTVDSLEAMRIFGGLLSAGMSRGVDATGLAWVSNESGQDVINVHKAPLPAAEFVSERLPSVWPTKTPEIVIGHTRASTKGSEDNNLNNHPVFDARAGIAAVHNGCIRNDNELFKEHQIERDAQVDSEIIPKMIGYEFWDGDSGIRGDMDAAIKTSAEELAGSFAFLALSAYHPGKLWLVKNHNPAYLCLIPDWQMILIASEDAYFDEAVGQPKVWLDFFETWECSVKKIVREVESNSIIRIDRNVEKEDDIIHVDTFNPLVENRWTGKPSGGSLWYGGTPDTGRQSIGDGYEIIGDVFAEGSFSRAVDQDDLCLWRMEGACASPGSRCGRYCSHGSVSGWRRF